MIAVQSSASNCSASAVEPTTSANNAVTTLRSAGPGRAARILSASGAGARRRPGVRGARSSAGVLVAVAGRS
jgi:hypothetical protein